MKIVILVDMEGATGIDGKCVEIVDCFSEEWRNSGRQLITEDVKMVIDECESFGVESITVCDIHNQGNSIIKEYIGHKNINWVSKIFNLNLDEGNYDYAILVGFHPMQQKDGIFPHTLRNEIKNIYINNNIVGELGIYISMLREKNIPTIMVIGDYHCIKEAKEIIPKCIGTIVKTKLGQNINLLSRKEANNLIKKNTRISLNNRDNLGLANLIYPLNVRLEFFNDYFISEFNNYENLNFKIDNNSLVWNSDSYEEMFCDLIKNLSFVIRLLNKLKCTNKKFFKYLKETYPEIASNNLFIEEISQIGKGKKFMLLDQTDRKKIFDVLIKYKNL